MKIKVNGQFLNGIPFEVIYPKYSVSQTEIEALYQNWQNDMANNTSTTNGIGLDYNSFTAEIIDDEIIEPAEISRLKCVLYDMQMLANINSYMNTKNGKTKIWWENVQTVDFYHPLVQEAITDLNLPIETAKDIWRQAKLID